MSFVFLVLQMWLPEAGRLVSSLGRLCQDLKEVL
jgi:hypothetical protein